LTSVSVKLWPMLLPHPELQCGNVFNVETPEQKESLFPNLSDITQKPHTFLCFRKIVLVCYIVWTFDIYGLEKVQQLKCGSWQPVVIKSCYLWVMWERGGATGTQGLQFTMYYVLVSMQRR